MIKQKLKILLHKELKEKNIFTVRELLSIISGYMPENKEITYRWWINVLHKDNFIHQIGRGIYAFTKNPDYQPCISLKSRRMYNAIQESIPCYNLALYETPLLADLLDIKPVKHYIFLHVPKDKLNYAFYEIQRKKKNVVYKPTREIITRYVLPFEEAILLYPLLNQMPLLQVKHYTTFPIEGVLVNSYIYGRDFLSFFDIQIDQIFNKAFAKYSVNIPLLLRYAASRNKKKQISTILENNDLLIERNP